MERKLLIQDEVIQETSADPIQSIVTNSEV